MKRLIPILLAVFAFAACEKDPDMDKLDNDYLVYTNYDKKANFKEFTTYYLPDKILVISDKEEPEYLEGEAAQEILAAYKSNMDNRGYTMAASKEDADLGVQVSYIKSTDNQNGGGDIQDTGAQATGVTGVADGIIRML